MNQDQLRPRHAVRRDEKPWYRQFWPWFIISLPVSSVIVSMTILWLAITNPDHSVLDEAGYQNLRAELKAQPKVQRQSDSISEQTKEAVEGSDTP